MYTSLIDEGIPYEFGSSTYIFPLCSKYFCSGWWGTNCLSSHRFEDLLISPFKEFILLISSPIDSWNSSHVGNHVTFEPKWIITLVPSKFDTHYPKVLN